MRSVFHFLLTTFIFGLGAQAQTNEVAQAPAPPPLKVTSTAFSEGEQIPIQYTCHGVGISPPIDWEGAPASTESFAIICEDPDASYKSFTHWIIFNIPKDATGLPEKVPNLVELTNGTLQGLNDYKKPGYRGPCPPSGVHRYYFTVYALDNKLLLLGDVDKAKILEAMDRHIVAQGQLMGTYGR